MYSDWSNLDANGRSIAKSAAITYYKEKTLNEEQD